MSAQEFLKKKNSLTSKHMKRCHIISTTGGNANENPTEIPFYYT